jgi:hypothetical protein
LIEAEGVVTAVPGISVLPIYIDLLGRCYCVWVSDYVYVLGSTSILELLSLSFSMAPDLHIGGGTLPTLTLS